MVNSATDTDDPRMPGGIDRARVTDMTIVSAKLRLSPGLELRRVNRAKSLGLMIGLELWL